MASPSRQEPPLRGQGSVRVPIPSRVPPPDPASIPVRDPRPPPAPSPRGAALPSHPGRPVRVALHLGEDEVPGFEVVWHGGTGGRGGRGGHRARAGPAQAAAAPGRRRGRPAPHGTQDVPPPVATAPPIGSAARRSVYPTNRSEAAARRDNGIGPRHRRRRSGGRWGAGPEGRGGRGWGQGPRGWGLRGTGIGDKGWELTGIGTGLELGPDGGRGYGGLGTLGGCQGCGDRDYGRVTGLGGQGCGDRVRTMGGINANPAPSTAPGSAPQPGDAAPGPGAIPGLQTPSELGRVVGGHVSGPGQGHQESHLGPHGGNLTQRVPNLG